VKAHQRIIREQQSAVDTGGLFGYPTADIKSATCRTVDFTTAKSMILQYEWLGTMGSTQHHYGIYFENVLAGVVCFGYFQSMFNASSVERGGGYSKYVGTEFWDKGVQLTRGACAHWAHPHSGSKLISYGLKQMSVMGYKFVIAFSDSKAGEIGTLYQATNWYYIGASKTAHYDILRADGTLYLNNRDFNKQQGGGGFKRKTKFIESVPELQLKLSPVDPKSRYIYLIGSKKENRIMHKSLKPHIKPYPKRVESNRGSCERD
jgi:hypothetical protein